MDIRIAIAICMTVFLTANTVQAAPNLTNEVDQSATAQPAAEISPQTVPQETVVQEVKKEPVKAPREKAPVEVKQLMGCEYYRNEISKYGWNVDVALKVMRAESGCNPNAVGDNRVIRGLYAPSCGLFQIRTLKGRPTCGELKNPVTNVSWAWKLYKASGWRPWSVCNNGTVYCY